MRVRWILLLALFVSCSEEEVIPKDIIPQKQMESVLFDMLLADRYTSQFIAKDTSKNIKLENLKLYDQVFQIHHISKEHFIKSFKYYLQRPDITKVMFDSLSASANRRRGEVYMSAPKE